MNLLLAWGLLVGCSAAAVSEGLGDSGDAGGEELDQEDASETEEPGSDSGDTAGWEQPEEEQEEQEQEEEGGWEIGDAASGTGPFWPGTGRQEFQLVFHGDDVTWERGVQGGHHIWVAVEAEREVLDALDEDSRRDVRHTYRFYHEDGEQLAVASRRGGFRLDEEAGQWRAMGLYAVLTAPRRPSTMDGDLIRYELEMELGTEVFHREVWLVSQCCD